MPRVRQARARCPGARIDTNFSNDTNTVHHARATLIRVNSSNSCSFVSRPQSLARHRLVGHFATAALRAFAGQVVELRGRDGSQGRSPGTTGLNLTRSAERGRVAGTGGCHAFVRPERDVREHELTRISRMTRIQFIMLRATLIRVNSSNSCSFVSRPQSLARHRLVGHFATAALRAFAGRVVELRGRDGSQGRSPGTTGRT